MGLRKPNGALHNTSDHERPDEHAPMQAVAVLVDSIDKLIAELRPSYKAQELHSAMSYPVSGSTATTRPVVGRGKLRGYGLRETTGAAPATVLLHAGADATGHVIVPITLSAGESVRDWFGDEGIAILGGLFVEIVAGAVEGSIYLAPEA